jgi:hypothetical protein
MMKKNRNYWSPIRAFIHSKTAAIFDSIHPGNASSTGKKFIFMKHLIMARLLKILASDNRTNGYSSLKYILNIINLNTYPRAWK